MPASVHCMDLLILHELLASLHHGHEHTEVWNPFILDTSWNLNLLITESLNTMCLGK